MRTTMRVATRDQRFASAIVLLDPLNSTPPGITVPEMLRSASSSRAIGSSPGAQMAKQSRSVGAVTTGIKQIRSRAVRLADHAADTVNSTNAWPAVFAKVADQTGMPAAVPP